MLRFKLLAAFAAALFIFWIAIAGMAQSQKLKTVKLSSGQEVVDISGLWDTQIENYGEWVGYGKYSTVTEIKQDGSSFVGIRLKATPYNEAGSETLRGELEKNGFKKIQCITGMGAIDAVGKIITFDIPDKAKLIMTKKE